MRRKIVILLAILAVAASLLILIFAVKKPFAKEENTDLVTLAEVKAELDGYQFSQHDNLTFDCEVPQIQADKLYAVTSESLKPPTEKTEERLRLLMSLITPVDLSHIEAEYMKDTSGNPYAVQLDNSDGEGSQYGQLGRLYEGNTFLCVNLYRKHPGFGTPNKVINIEDEAEINEKVDLPSGESMSIKQAEEKTSALLNKISENGFINQNESFRLKNAMIEDNEVGQDILLRYEHIFEGLPVDTSGFVDPYSVNGEMRPSYIEAVVAGDGEFTYITNCYYYKPDDYSPIEKILPLSKAEQRASDVLAMNLKYTVSEVNLKYCCYLKDTGGEFTYRPMWFFYLQDRQATNTFVNAFPCLCLYVDAVSGDVYLCDSAAWTLSIYE